MSDQPSSNLHRIIAVVGPTATGKTALALWLAEQAVAKASVAGVLIVSVDSRQVYEGLEICTGAEVPSNWQPGKVFRHPELPITLCGVSMISPLTEWSVNHFRNYALPKIQLAFAQQMMVILVGGTGLYHQHLFSTDSRLSIPPNEQLRHELLRLPLQDLQQRVETVAQGSWSQMNASDRANPRRLIRVLEQLFSSTVSDEQANDNSIKLPFDCATVSYVTVGITDDIDTLKQKIAERVETRLQNGATREVEGLIAHYTDEQWRLPAFSSTGCRELRMYIEDRVDIDQLKELWIRRELQYAKRQLTWWKKHPAATSVFFQQKREHWYDLSQENGPGWQTEVRDSCILSL